MDNRRLQVIGLAQQLFIAQYGGFLNDGVAVRDRYPRCLADAEELLDLHTAECNLVLQAATKPSTET